MKQRWLEPLIVFAVFAADRISKALALRHLTAGPVGVMPHFSLTYVENTGVAFGMFRDNNYFFMVLSAVLVAALLIFRRRLPASAAASRAGLALVLGGALGNLYDRLAYGFVVDFFNVSFFPAVFNAADSAITAGAGLLAIGMNKKQESGKARG